MPATDTASVESIFASPAMIDDTISADERYQRKPAGSSDQGRRED